jgi:ATP-binding cassette, subfamily F, member 3
LILDEPTNHLDLDMRDALAMALQGYEGAVVIVSHDRSLLEKTVDDFWLLRAGALTSFQGDLDDYADLERIVPGSSKKTSHSKKSDRQARAKKRAAEQALRKKVTHLERSMEKSGAKLADIEQRLADKATYESLDKDALDKLLKETGQLRKHLEQTEEEWLSATQTLEETIS